MGPAGSDPITWFPVSPRMARNRQKLEGLLGVKVDVGMGMFEYHSKSTVSSAMHSQKCERNCRWLGSKLGGHKNVWIPFKMGFFLLLCTAKNVTEKY